MKNMIQQGDTLELAAPYDRTSGQGALIGSIFGVAQVDVLSGVRASFAVAGVFDLTKASGAVTEGAKLYWDNTAKNVTTTSTSNTLIGCATQAAASGDATARVRLGIVA
jgi:predicted RecA/RadA family phage recombinase